MGSQARAGDKLRKPLLVLALVAVGVSVLVCLGSAWFTSPAPFGERVNSTLQSPATADMLDKLDIDRDDASDSLSKTRPQGPPGLAIRSLALTGGVLFLVLTLTAAPLLIGDRVTGSIQGVVSIVTGLLLAIAAVVSALAAFAALFVMVVLLTSAPFGTLAYLAIYGHFNTGAAAVFTGLILALDLAALVLLALAQQRFLRSRGLVALMLTAIVLVFGTAFLHGLVPGFLVSIADAIAALVISIVAAIWAILVIIGGIVAAVRVLQLGRQSSSGNLTRP